MSWALSTHQLYSNGDHTEQSRHSRQLLRLAWQTVYGKCQKFCSFFRRETNKSLPKELRRSLRLSKSAKRKGYQQYQSEADKRLLDAHLRQPINISIRIGPAYEYLPSNS